MASGISSPPWISRSSRKVVAPVVSIFSQRVFASHLSAVAWLTKTWYCLARTFLEEPSFLPSQRTIGDQQNVDSSTATSHSHPAIRHAVCTIKKQRVGEGRGGVSWPCNASYTS